AGPPRTVLQFDVTVRDHRTVDGSVDDDVRYPDLAINAGLFADHQRAGIAVGRDHVSANDPIAPEPALEIDVAVDDRSRADQAVDAFLGRRVLLPFEHGSSSGDHKRSAGTGARLTGLEGTRRHRPYLGARRDPDSR